MVIAEAENIRLGVPTFEDEHMDDDQDPEPTEPGHTSGHRSVYAQAADYRRAKELLYDYDTLNKDKAWAINKLENLWQEGFTVAAHLLGKLYRDGIEVPKDMQTAKKWFLRSATAGNDYSQYALGKMLLDEKSPDAVSWLKKAAEYGNQHAQYKLGKLYLTGELVNKDIETAIRYLKDAAQHKEDLKMSAININKNNFQSEVMNSDKPVLLDFWAPWCGPCRMVVPIVEEIARERKDIKVGKVNVDEQPELASRFGVMSIPTLVVMKDGKIVNQAMGARPKNAILGML